MHGLVGVFIDKMKLMLSWSQLLACVTLSGLFVISEVGYSDSDRLICSQRYAYLVDSYDSKPRDSLQMRVGIEIEGSVPLKVNTHGIAEIAKNLLSKHYKKVEISNYFPLQIYQIIYRKKNGVDKILRIDIDPTIITSRAPFEIASPILEDSEDFKVFWELIREIKKRGGQSETASAGVHIHIDFEGATAGEMATLAAVFSEIEADLLNRFAISKERLRYAAPTSQALLDFLNDRFSKEEPSVYSFFDQLGANYDRYHALNLRSYLQHQTVEFRLFNSTLNIEALDLMVDFSSKLVKAVRTKKPELLNYLTKDEKSIELDQLAKVLDLKLGNPETRRVFQKIINEASVARRDHVKAFSGAEKALSRLALLLGISLTINQSIEKLGLLPPTLKEF